MRALSVAALMLAASPALALDVKVKSDHAKAKMKGDGREFSRLGPEEMLRGLATGPGTLEIVARRVAPLVARPIQVRVLVDGTAATVFRIISKPVDPLEDGKTLASAAVERKVEIPVGKHAIAVEVGNGDGHVLVTFAAATAPGADVIAPLVAAAPKVEAAPAKTEKLPSPDEPIALEAAPLTAAATPASPTPGAATAEAAPKSAATPADVKPAAPASPAPGAAAADAAIKAAAAPADVKPAAPASLAPGAAASDAAIKAAAAAPADVKPAAPTSPAPGAAASDAAIKAAAAAPADVKPAAPASPAPGAPAADGAIKAAAAPADAKQATPPSADLDLVTPLTADTKKPAETPPASSTATASTPPASATVPASAKPDAPTASGSPPAASAVAKAPDAPKSPQPGGRPEGPKSVEAAKSSAGGAAKAIVHGGSQAAAPAARAVSLLVGPRVGLAGQFQTGSSGLALGVTARNLLTGTSETSGMKGILLGVSADFVTYQFTYNLGASRFAPAFKQHLSVHAVHVLAEGLYALGPMSLGLPFLKSTPLTPFAGACIGIVPVQMRLENEFGIQTPEDMALAAGALLGADLALGSNRLGLEVRYVTARTGATSGAANFEIGGFFAQASWRFGI
jgi:hypothetical protein